MKPNVKQDVQLIHEAIEGAPLVDSLGREGVEFVVGTLTYRKFSSCPSKRGYYLETHTQREQQCEGYTSISRCLSLGAPGDIGYSTCIESTGQFSAKRLAELAANPNVRLELERMKINTLMQYRKHQEQKEGQLATV